MLSYLENNITQNGTFPSGSVLWGCHGSCFSDPWMRTTALEELPVLHIFDRCGPNLFATPLLSWNLSAVLSTVCVCMSLGARNAGEVEERPRSEDAEKVCLLHLHPRLIPWHNVVISVVLLVGTTATIYAFGPKLPQTLEPASWMLLSLFPSRIYSSTTPAYWKYLMWDVKE